MAEPDDPAKRVVENVHRLTEQLLEIGLLE
jgi:hypothetical protein